MGYDNIAAALKSAVKGYIAVRLPGHPRANRSGYVREHVAIATVALGKPLPSGAVVHHINGCKGDNKRSNLVVCPNEAYHKALHVRMRIQKMGGNPWTERWCCTCHKVVAITGMGKRGAKLSNECKACISSRVQRIAAQRKAS